MKRPVMRYHGGKWKLGEWIIRHFPQHRVYVEPFGGAASVLLQKQRAHTEVYGDCCDEVVNVFRVLRDPGMAEELRRLCALTPFARSELLATYDVDEDPIENARRMIFRSFAGYGSASATRSHKTGFRGQSRNSGTAPAMDWRNWPAHIAEFAERLRGVVIECRPALDLIRTYDSAETLFYLDPPYVHSTREFRWRNTAYRFEMTDDEHRELLQLLTQIDGMAIVSGYRSDIYDAHLSAWQRVDQRGFADGGADRTESLWINDAAMSHGQQYLELS